MNLVSFKPEPTWRDSNSGAQLSISAGTVATSSPAPHLLHYLPQCAEEPRVANRNTDDIERD